MPTESGRRRLREKRSGTAEVHLEEIDADLREAVDQRESVLNVPRLNVQGRALHGRELLQGFVARNLPRDGELHDLRPGRSGDYGGELRIVDREHAVAVDLGGQDDAQGLERSLGGAQYFLVHLEPPGRVVNLRHEHDVDVGQIKLGVSG